MLRSAGLGSVFACPTRARHSLDDIEAIDSYPASALQLVGPNASESSIAMDSFDA